MKKRPALRTCQGREGDEHGAVIQELSYVPDWLEYCAPGVGEKKQFLMEETDERGQNVGYTKRLYISPAFEK